MAVVQDEYRERMKPGRAIERDGHTYYIQNYSDGRPAVHWEDGSMVRLHMVATGLSDDEVLNVAFERKGGGQRPPPPPPPIEIKGK